jgi:hypothetical protein
MKSSAIETTIKVTSEVLSRSGSKTTLYITSPSNAPLTKEAGRKRYGLALKIILKVYATYIPTAAKSPCAKLATFVVNSVNERPTASNERRFP